MSLIINRRAPSVPATRWFDYADDGEVKTKIKIRHIDNEPYQVALARARRITERSDMRAGNSIVALDGEKSAFLQQCEVVGRYLVEDWQGVGEVPADAPEGTKPVDAEYTPERAEALLAADVEFFAWVIARASELAAERRQGAAATAGKPLSASNGSTASEQDKSKGKSQDQSETPSQAT